MSLYPFISRRLLYPLYERAARRNFLDKLESLEESQWWGQNQIREHQWKKLKTLIDHVHSNNAFYRRRFEHAGVRPDQIQDFSDLEKLPVLTKAEIVEHFSELISIGYSPKTLVLDKTSGSTGRNLVFYNDRNTLNWMTAAVLRNMAWYNVSFGDQRFKLWGALANESPSQRLYMWARNLCLRERLLSSYELDEKRLARIVRLIKRGKPKALVGYVSALEILSRYIERQGISGLYIPAIIPAAETLFDHQRVLFRRVFGADIFNRYGCHEFTAIAHECDRHQGMHINSEAVYLEVVKDGKSVAPGETGEIVITDLENFGFPFVRYRMEDLGSLGQDCSCGRGLPMLERVDGRVYDLISCPNGTVQTGTFFCKMTRSVEGIEQFQVIQEAPDRLRFKLVTGDKFSRESIEFVEDKIKEHCGEQMEVVFDFVRDIETLKSGKRRYVVSLPARGQAVLETT